MSFRLQGPSLLLNSYAFTDIFGGCGMFMDITWNCPDTATAKDVVNWIGIACSQSPGKRLANIVMNFHGDPGQVHIGEASPEIFPGPGKRVWVPATFNDIDITNVGTFSALRSYTIGTIWFHSCALAGGQVGKRFCRQLALNAQCRVVAPEDTQTEWFAFLNVLFMPKGCIDDYEGKVYLWLPNGEQRDFNPNDGNWL